MKPEEKDITEDLILAAINDAKTKSEEAAAEESTVNHCTTHLRFRKHCLDCLKAVAAI